MGRLEWKGAVEREERCNRPAGKQSVEEKNVRYVPYQRCMKKRNLRRGGEDEKKERKNAIPTPEGEKAPFCTFSPQMHCRRQMKTDRLSKGNTRRLSRTYLFRKNLCIERKWMNEWTYGEKWHTALTHSHSGKHRSHSRELVGTSSLSTFPPLFLFFLLQLGCTCNSCYCWCHSFTGISFLPLFWQMIHTGMCGLRRGNRGLFHSSLYDINTTFNTIFVLSFPLFYDRQRTRAREFCWGLLVESLLGTFLEVFNGLKRYSNRQCKWISDCLAGGEERSLATRVIKWGEKTTRKLKDTE